MVNSEQELANFTMLVRQLLRKYTELRTELKSVQAKLSAQEREAKDMEILASASMHDYDMLKAAKMLEVSDGDIANARKRVNKLIRDVDRCITLLTEQQTISS